MGLTTREHMEFAEKLPHQGHKVMDTDMPEDLLEAWKFGARNAPEVIDAER